MENRSGTLPARIVEDFAPKTLVRVQKLKFSIQIDTIDVTDFEYVTDTLGDLVPSVQRHARKTGLIGEHVSICNVHLANRNETSDTPEYLVFDIMLEDVAKLLYCDGIKHLVAVLGVPEMQHPGVNPTGNQEAAGAEAGKRKTDSSSADRTPNKRQASSNRL